MDTVLHNGSTPRIEWNGIIVEKEHDFIFLWNAFWNGYPERSPYAYKIKKELFIKLIKQWQIIDRTNPDKIILEYDEEKEFFELVGFHHDSRMPYTIILVKQDPAEVTSYQTKDLIYNKIDELLRLLIHESSNNGKRWINFLCDPSCDYFRTDTTGIEKINNIAYISYVKRDYRPLKDAYAISIDDLLRLINEWKKLSEQYMVIEFTKLGDVITLKGYN